jgi:hypothetical protein
MSDHFENILLIEKRKRKEAEEKLRKAEKKLKKYEEEKRIAEKKHKEEKRIAEKKHEKEKRIAEKRHEEEKRIAEKRHEEEKKIAEKKHEKEKRIAEKKHEKEKERYEKATHLMYESILSVCHDLIRPIGSTTSIIQMRAIMKHVKFKCCTIEELLKILSTRVESANQPKFIDKGFLERFRSINQSNIHAITNLIQEFAESGLSETNQDLLDSILTYLREITIRYRKTGVHGENRVDFSVSKDNPKDLEIRNQRFIHPEVLVNAVQSHNYHIEDIEVEVYHGEYFTLNIEDLVVPLEFKKSIGHLESESITEETLLHLPGLRNGVAQIIGRFAQTLKSDTNLRSYQKNTPFLGLLMDERDLYVILIELNPFWLQILSDNHPEAYEIKLILNCSIFPVRLKSVIAQLCILLGAYLSDGIVLKPAADVYEFYENPPCIPPFLIYCADTDQTMRLNVQKVHKADFLFDKAVCMATDENMNFYCLKSELWNMEDQSALLKRESEHLKKLNSLSVVRIPRLISYGLDTLTSYYALVTEPYGNAVKGLNLNELKEYLHDLTECLNSLHSAGYLHADISPSNIIYDQETGYRLIDFECAIRIGERTTGRFTEKFSSINISSDLPCYPNDDWESLLYTTLELLDISLPWKDIFFDPEKVIASKRRFLDEVQQHKFSIPNQLFFMIQYVFGDHSKPVKRCDPEEFKADFHYAA